MTSVRADIEQCTKGRICVKFPYSKSFNFALQTIPGATFTKRGKRHWHVPQDLLSCRMLRQIFGDSLELGPALKQWGKDEVRLEKKMSRIAVSETGSLRRLWSKLPGLAEAIHLGPKGRYMTLDQRQAALAGPGSYQASDVTFLAESPAPLNGNEQGLGKTIEWIGAVWEGGHEEGDHLVVCPVSAIDGTWEPELRAWQEEAGEDVAIFACVDSRANVEQVMQDWQDSTAKVRWLVLNPDKIKWTKYRRLTEDELLESVKGLSDDGAQKKLIRKARLKLNLDLSDIDDVAEMIEWIMHEQEIQLPELTRNVKGKKEENACYCSASFTPHEHYTTPYPILYKTKWATACVDEAHRGGFKTPNSVMRDSFKHLKIEKQCAMTGTPMSKLGGSDIWGLLNLQDRKKFSSKWSFFAQFYEIDDSGHFGKKVGELRQDREIELGQALAPYMLRRLKKEVFPELPLKQYVEVECTMTTRQKQQYDMMTEEAWAPVGVGEIATTSHLAQRTRRKQLANAHSKVDKITGKIAPISSPKVDALMRKIDEIGLHDPETDPIGTGKHLIFSRSRLMVDFICNVLRTAGIECGAITGGTKSDDRKRLINSFQQGTLPVMVIVTSAGGVSLTLDMADSVHLIDESESPGDDEQAEDRAHRVSRFHQVIVYIYRTAGTIDFDIADLKKGKSASHALVLDRRRELTKKRLGL